MDEINKYYWSTFNFLKLSNEACLSSLSSYSTFNIGQIYKYTEYKSAHWTTRNSESTFIDEIKIYRRNSLLYYQNNLLSDVHIESPTYFVDYF